MCLQTKYCRFFLCIKVGFLNKISDVITYPPMNPSKVFIDKRNIIQNYTKKYITEL